MRRTEKALLSTAFLLLTAWFALIILRWDELQIMRRADPLWLLHILAPELLIIIIGLTLIIFYSLLRKIDYIWFHAALITIFSAVLLCTPYFIGGIARFPDTFGVIHSVQNLPSILNGASTEYASDYPLSYLLFHSVDAITQQSLFEFSLWVFSPMVLIFFLLMWYLFIRRISTPNIAFLATTLVIPVLIIEVSITPNAVGMILVASSLLLLSVDNIFAKTLVVVLSAVLVLVHPMNIIILFIFLISFALVNAFTKEEPWPKISIPSLLFPLIAVGWLSWSILASQKGMGMITTIIRIFRTGIPKMGPLEYVSGGNASNYYWIQQIMLGSYLIFTVSGIIIVVCMLLHILSRRANGESGTKCGLFGERNNVPYMLIPSIVLFAVALASYYLISGGEQIVSRSMNYALLSLAFCISALTIAISRRLIKTGKNSHWRAFACVCAIMFIFISVAYPIFGYSKDSYISFTEPHGSGKMFYEAYLRDIESVEKFEYSLSSHSAATMHSTNHLKAYEQEEEAMIHSALASKVYKNRDYATFLKVFQSEGQRTGHQ